MGTKILFIKLMYKALYYSPWPACVGISTFFLAIAMWSFITNSGSLLFVAFFSLFTMSGLWIKDLMSERLLGCLTREEKTIIKIGFILFIMREVMLFFSLFWCFFHSSLVPTIQIGAVWPPRGINIINGRGVPLLNTVILLVRGCTLTWAHSARDCYKLNAITALFLTVVLGWIFLYLQYEEYITCSFRMASVFGGIFFLATGFHGAHVLLGTLGLLCSWTFFSTIYYYSHSIAFLFSAWYWHFVDVVWLFLFIIIYWWGG